MINAGKDSVTGVVTSFGEPERQAAYIAIMSGGFDSRTRGLLLEACR